MSALLQAALRYADLGYPVFPCVPGDSKPLTTHGFLDASTDPDQIERWWTEHPNANIGLSTAGLVVIDIDGASNPWPGPERALELAVGPFATTPGGGTHRVFRQSAGKAWRCTQSVLAPQVDTRADGGYIVASPSRRPDGEYRWVQELDVSVSSLPEPPAWLIEQLDGVVAGTPGWGSDPMAGVVSNEIPTGHRNATLARLGGAMRRVGMSQPEIFAALVCANADRCQPPLEQTEVERIAESIARYQPDEVFVALAENHWEQMYEERPEDEEANVQVDPGGIPSGLLRIPGFINELIDYTLETAPYPEPTLAFCGALSLQAFLAGRKVRDPSDNRTNLYLLGLANSGAGKDYPRKINQRILLEAGLPGMIGDTFSSGEGIEDCLFLNPAMLFQTDEIDGLMTKINLGKDARHEGIMNVLLKMYTSANSQYPMRVKAGKEPGVIDQPCLCIFGTAIPKHYYEALSLKMLTNGFFARMIILEAGRRGRGQEARMKPLPATILSAARWWAEFKPSGRAGNLADWHPQPETIEYSPEAASVLREFREHADGQYSRAETRNDGVSMAIWARANEKARRLALIYACSRDHLHLEITADAARWACEFVSHQTQRMLFMAGASVSENEFDSRCKKLLTSLRAWRDAHGDTWMPFWKLNRKHPWSEREHEEVRTTLLNQRLIAYQERRTGGTPQRLYRLA